MGTYEVRFFTDELHSWSISLTGPRKYRLLRRVPEACTVERVMVGSAAGDVHEAEWIYCMRDSGWIVQAPYLSRMESSSGNTFPSLSGRGSDIRGR